MSVTRRSFLATASAAFACARFSFATEPASTRFDITQEAVKLFGPVELDYRSGWQSFGFDVPRGRILYTQPAPVDNDGGITSAKAAGELRVGALSLDGNREKGVMQFADFGHGGSTGVESAEDGTYLWVETDGVPHGEYCYGRRLARILWNSQKKRGPIQFKDLETKALPGSRIFTLKPGSTENSPSIDNDGKRLMLRYRWPGGNGKAAGMYYSIYNLSDVMREGDNAKPVFDAISEAEVLLAGNGKPYKPFQGMALHGDYGYILTGPKSKSQNDASDAPIHLICFRLGQNKLLKTAAPSTMGQTLSGREPEGVAVMADGAKTRICWAMKSDGRTLNAKGTVRQQLMTVYTQDRQISALLP